MNTLKFNSFANSPKTLSPYPSQLPTQQSFSPHPPQNPFTSIPQLKKQMQQAINSRRTTEGNKKIHSKYPSQISLMKSNISLMSTIQVHPDLPLTMLQLEVGFTQQLLALRQDKITLMEAYNKIVDDRLRVERELARLKKNKDRQSSDINELSIFDNQNSSDKKKIDKQQAQLKNSKLKFQFQELDGRRASNLTDRQQQDQIVAQIEKVQESSRIIQQKISKIEDNTRPDEQKRFQTFFPQKKTGKSSQPTPSQLQQIRKLREDKDILYRHLADWSPNYELREYFYQLIDENRELHEKSDKIFFGSQVMEVNLNGLDRLRQKVREEQEGKHRYFEDLRRFKEQAVKYRRQNQELKERLRA